MSPKASPTAQLGALLGMKTKAGYSDIPVSNDQLVRATRAMEALVDRANR